MNKGLIRVTSDLLTRVYKLPLDKMLRGKKLPVASDEHVVELKPEDELEVVWNWSPWMVLNGKL